VGGLRIAERAGFKKRLVEKSRTNGAENATPFAENSSDGGSGTTENYHRQGICEARDVFH